MAAVVMGMAVMVVVPASAYAQRERDGRNRQDRSSRDDDRDRGPRETEQVDRTIAVPTDGRLRLKNFSGDVRIVGTSRRDIQLRATRRGTREQLDHIRLDVSTSGSTVTIEANKRDDSWEREHRNNNVVETRFELEVPASIRLDVDAFSSDVQVENVNGESALKTFSGEIIVLNPTSAIDAETFSGDIRLTVGRSAKGDLSFSTFSGSVDTSLPITSTSWRKRSVDGTLPGGSGPRMKFHTFSGDLKITSR
jgi:DUF4097 and DUF4098 domain-containing protein YvlB